MVPVEHTLQQNEAFFRDYNQIAADRLQPGLRARLIARIRWNSLDRKLADGADPATCAPLAARAARLTSRMQRGRLADALDHLLDTTHGTQRRWWAVVRYIPVRENAATFERLAELLRSDRPLPAQGIAMLLQLLTDGCGACHHGSAEQLASALERVCNAMTA
jgi:hypothetical protein